MPSVTQNMAILDDQICRSGGWPSQRARRTDGTDGRLGEGDSFAGWTAWTSCSVCRESQCASRQDDTSTRCGPSWRRAKEVRDAAGRACPTRRYAGFSHTGRALSKASVFAGARFFEKSRRSAGCLAGGVSQSFRARPASTRGFIASRSTCASIESARHRGTAPSSSTRSLCTKKWAVR